jgi:drug/metabolite transporter (DMT)-like permease
LSLNPTTSCIIISTSPIITAFLAQAVFGERPGRAGWLGIGTAFAGILIITLWDGELLVSGGVVWMLAAAVLISLYNVLQRGLGRYFGPLEITAYSFFAGTLLLLPFLPGAVEEVRTATFNHTALVCFLGICPSALAYLSWAKALALAPKTGNVSNYMFLTPFLALLLEYFVTGELPGSGTFVGGAVILAGLAFFVVAGKGQRTK